MTAQALERIPGAATEAVPIPDIVLGERAGRNTGSVQKLARSIASEGMACPVAISPRGRLITGTRRLAAHEMLGQHRIEAMVITTVPQALGVLLAEQADGRHAMPLTLLETLALDHVMRQELEWWPRQPPGHRVAGPGGHNAEVAHVLGLNSKQYAMAREILAAARGYREHMGQRTLVSDAMRARAIEAAARMRHKSQIHPVFNWFKQDVPDEVFSRRVKQRDLVDSISSALGTLKGLATGLREVDLSDITIPPAQAATWADDLTEGLAVLQAFQKQLRKAMP